MNMNVHTVSWLVFLALIKYFSCDENNPFILKEEHLTAVEGSCVEIKCEPGRYVSGLYGDYWFWMKDATWNDLKKDFSGSVIYSSDESERPVDPVFKDRVHYIDSSPPSWRHYFFQPDKLCKILICDLKTSDSGNYMFRFHGRNERWRTDPGTTLTVDENPCPISFEGPKYVKENEVVTLRCSTLSSCPSNLQIVTLMQQPSTQLSSSSRSETESPKIITQSFSVSWKDDGIEFSCQTEKNEDKYLMKNISLTVEYAPKEVKAEKSSEYVKERDSVTLTCSASGRPSVTFSWFKDAGKKSSDDKLKFTSIKASDRGSYFCKAENKLGSENSNAVHINVLYAPEVEVKIREEHPGGSHHNIQEGDKITLECSVKRSNPQPQTFSLLKNGSLFATKQTYVFNQIQAHDTGSYTCTAQNQAGSGTSEPYHLQVHYRFSFLTAVGTVNIVKLFFTIFGFLLIIFLLGLLLFRRWRNKSVQQGTANTQPCWGLLGWRNRARQENTNSDAGSADHLRSKDDDVLADQPCRPMSHQSQPHPDVSSASITNPDNCTVDLPHRNQREQERLGDYENISAVQATKPRDPCDSDTAEYEMKLNVTQVNFKIKSGYQRVQQL